MSDTTKFVLLKIEDAVRACNKEYYQNNRVEILQKKKQKLTCACGSVVTKGNMLRHCRTKKHMVFIK